MSKLIKHLPEIDSTYRQVEFELYSIHFHERIPKQSLKSLDFIRAEVTAIKTKLGLPITYKNIRFSLTPEGKKKADMVFITYFAQKHARNAENAPLAAKLHYRWLYLCYFPELSYINKHIESKETFRYIQQWGYMQAINPSFIELIHGTHINSALYAIENIN